MFASDYPVLSMERCLGEAAALDLPDEVRRRRGCYGNATAFFFGAGSDGCAPKRNDTRLRARSRS